MKNADIMNILFSFIFIGIIILVQSVKSTLWALYWILFSLYLTMFFIIGIRKNSKGSTIIREMLPLVIVCVLITWLLQIFRSNNQLILDDSYIRKMQFGIPKIPDIFYQVYAATLFFLFIKILIILKKARDSLIGKHEDADVDASDESFLKKNKAIISTVLELSIYGISIITFMLILALQVIVNFYITQG